MRSNALRRHHREPQTRYRIAVPPAAPHNTKLHKFFYHDCHSVKATRNLNLGCSSNYSLTSLELSSPFVFLFLRQDVSSQARSAVEAALAAIAEAETAGPPTEASTAAYDAVGMAQAALDRRYAAASDVGAASDASQGEDGAAAGQAAGGVGGSSGSGSSDILQDEAEMTKEPESARMTRDNPAASHSHMSHLLW